MRLILPALLLLASTAAGQSTLDLTGKPLATIPEAFTKISGAQELAGSLVIATDNMEAKVFLVDFAHGTRKQVGSKGQGPNEYQYPSPPVPAPAGIYVFDTHQRRALLIGRDGAIASMKTMPEGPLSRVRGSDASGRIYFEGGEFDPNTGRFTDSLPVVRWDPASNKVDQMVRVWGGGRVAFGRGANAGSAAREITPFPHLDAWVALPDGNLALLRHDPYRIDFVGATGTITRGAAIAATPIAITAKERDWYRDRNTPGRVSIVMQGGGSGPQRAGRQWEDEIFPATMPHFIGADVIASPEGSIWVPRSFTSTDKTRRYEIYDATGRLMGTALLDPHSRVVGFGAHSVYVARTDPSDDLVYLSKFAR